MPEIKISALDLAPQTPTGTEVFAVVQGLTTHKTTIDSLKPALVDNLSAGAPTWDVNGNLTAGYDIIAGGNHAGKVALTINDGYGNANLTFNHTDGIPDVNGSSGRITCAVDSNQEVMEFQLKGSVTAETPVTLTSVLKLYDDNIQLLQATTCLTPTQNTHVARKDYVDTALNLKATTASVTAVSQSLTNHIGATTSHTKAQVGLGSVDNTTDINKPISTATQTALNGKIGESEINTAHFIFANDTLSLKTIVEGQIGTGAVSPSKLSTGAPNWNNDGTLTIGGGVFTGSEAVEVNYWGSGDRNAYIDFHSQGAVGDNDYDYDARLFRYPGVDGKFELSNKGTGPITVDREIAEITDDKSIATKEYVDRLTPKNGFKKFGTWSSRNVNSSFYRQTFYISQDDKLMTAGYGNGYNMNGESDEKITGYTAPMIPLAKGEYVTEYYYSGNGAPSIYVLTNLKNLYASGYNGYGQLGLGDTTARQVFTKIPLSNVEFFSASHGWGNATHCGATTTDGSLYMWGHGGQGNLGLNSTATVRSPTKVSGTGPGGIIAKKVFTYSQYSCSYYIDSNRNVRVCGYNAFGNLGTGDFAQRNVFVLPQGARKADDIQCNSHDNRMTTYLVDGTTLWAAGHNGFGQLGRGNTTHSAEFITVPGVSVGSLNVSHFCVFVVQTNGTLRNWGYNVQGQLGVGDATQRTSPTAPSGSHTGVIKVISHDNYTSSWFLKSDGSIYSTGYNGHGQLGHGTTTARNTYKKVQMDDNLEFKDIESFGQNTGSQLLAVDKFNGLWGCGYNAQWSLGLNHYHTYKTVLTQLHTPS